MSIALLEQQHNSQAPISSCSSWRTVEVGLELSVPPEVDEFVGKYASMTSAISVVVLFKMHTFQSVFFYAVDYKTPA
jgi:hypothetical protein